MADNPVIPQPVTSGATDNPNAPQSGQPQNPPIPEGFSETPQEAGPPIPPGFSETPPSNLKINQNASPTEKEEGGNEADELLRGPESLMTGIIKGAGQTVSTAGKVGNAALQYGVPGYLPALGQGNPISEKINRGLKILDQATTPKDALEKIGVLGEGIGEFFLGDEALKGLGMAERLGLAQKVLDLTEKYPLFGKLLGHSLIALRQGTVAGGQSLAHEATPEEALHAAEGGALFGTMAGAGGQVIEGGINTAGRAGQMVRSVLDTSKKTTQELQPDFQDGIRRIVDGVAKEEGVSTGKAASIRDHIGEVAQNVEDKAVKMLKAVDEAAGQPFVQKFRQRLANIRREINSLPEAGGGPREAELEAEKDAVEKDMEEALNQAELKGVPRGQLDQGLQTFKKAQALFDLDKEIKKPSITKGLQPDFGTEAQAAANPEIVKASSFADRLQALHNKGRLEQALGDERAKNLMLHVYDTIAAENDLNKSALLAKGRIAAAKGVGKTAAKVAGGAGLLGAGSMIHRMMSEKGE